MEFDDLLLGPRLKGIPWKWGGTTTTEGFDCRTLTYHLLTERAGFKLEPDQVWLKDDADLEDLEAYLEQRAEVWNEVPAGDPLEQWDVIVTRNRTGEGPLVHFTVVIDTLRRSGLTVTRATGVVRTPIDALIDCVGRYRVAKEYQQ